MISKMISQIWNKNFYSNNPLVGKSIIILIANKLSLIENELILN
jgi:hypothetical protein